MKKTIDKKIIKNEWLISAKDSIWSKIGKVVSYIFITLIGAGLIMTLYNTIYHNYLFNTEGVIIEAKITNRWWLSPTRGRGKFGAYEFECEYAYKSITYKHRWRISYFSGHRYKVGDCVQVIISKENPKISRIYSESSYKCDN